MFLQLQHRLNPLLTDPKLGADPVDPLTEFRLISSTAVTSCSWGTETGGSELLQRVEDGGG